MKKIIAVLCFCAGLQHSIIQACDYCGCTGSNGSLSGQLFGSAIGIGNTWESYRLADNGTGVNGFGYLSGSIYGSYKPLPYFSIAASLPFTWGYVTGNSGRNNFTGLGDASLHFTFKPFQKMGDKMDQTLIAGAGIKFPTGKYVASSETGLEFDYGSALPLGTGSYDFLLSSAYTLSQRKGGLVIATNSKINTENKNHTRFGQQFQSQVLGYMQFFAGKVIFKPTTGIQYQFSGKNHVYDIPRKFTGGSVLSAAIKTAINTGPFEIMAGTNLPFWRQHPEDRIFDKPQFFLNFNYYITTKKDRS